MTIVMVLMMLGILLARLPLMKPLAHWPSTIVAVLTAVNTKYKGLDSAYHIGCGEEGRKAVPE